MDTRLNSYRIVIVRACLGLVGEMLQLIKYSSKHSLVFDLCQRDFSPEFPGLRPLCHTWWTVRTGALDSFLKNYETLIHTFILERSTLLAMVIIWQTIWRVMTQLELYFAWFQVKAICFLL